VEDTLEDLHYLLSSKSEMDMPDPISSGKMSCVTLFLVFMRICSYSRQVHMHTISSNMLSGQAGNVENILTLQHDEITEIEACEQRSSLFLVRCTRARELWDLFFANNMTRIALHQALVLFAILGAATWWKPQSAPPLQYCMEYGSEGMGLSSMPSIRT
jgi:hypothetical protein